MSLVSMTGFAEKRGSSDVLAWVWEIRGVNSKGFDLRIRLPDGYEGLDPVIRLAARNQLQRGAINVALKVVRTAAAGVAEVSEAGLAAAIVAVRRAEAAAMQAGLDLGPTNAAELLTLRGVLEIAENAEDDPSHAAIQAEIHGLMAEFNAMRRREGQAIAGVIAAQIDQIAALVSRASATLEARAARSQDTLRQRVAVLVGAANLPDEARLAQELALLAVKSDVSEELDRLTVHAKAARDMLQTGGPIGRKLDFLMQEFNRETNTLCAKAASSELTTIGLDLKVVIDQAREQVQNVE